MMKRTRKKTMPKEITSTTSGATAKECVWIRLTNAVIILKSPLPRLPLLTPITVMTSIIRTWIIIIINQLWNLAQPPPFPPPPP